MNMFFRIGDTEGLEHHINSRTLELLEKFAEYAHLNPELWNQFQEEKRPELRNLPHPLTFVGTINPTGLLNDLN